MRGEILVVVLPLVTACYLYDPAPPAPSTGTRVEAELTGDGSVALARQLGPNIAAVRGEIVASDEAGLLLALSSVTVTNHERMNWKGEQVRIPFSTVARVHQRKFSLGRSLLFGGAAIGALVAAGVAFGGDGSGIGGGVGMGGGPAPQ
jgi:hypothetical protein